MNKKIILPLLAVIGVGLTSCSDKELYFGKTLSYKGIEKVNYDYKSNPQETSIREVVTANFSKIDWDNPAYDNPTEEQKKNPNAFLDGCTTHAKAALDTLYETLSFKFSDRATSQVTISQTKEAHTETFKAVIEGDEFPIAYAVDSNDNRIAKIQPMNIYNNRIQSAVVSMRGKQSIYRTTIHWTQPVEGALSLYFDIYAHFAQ